MRQIYTRIFKILSGHKRLPLAHLARNRALANAMPAFVPSPRGFIRENP